MGVLERFRVSVGRSLEKVARNLTIQFGAERAENCQSHCAKLANLSLCARELLLICLTFVSHTYKLCLCVLHIAPSAIGPSANTHDLFTTRRTNKKKLVSLIRSGCNRTQSGTRTAESYH